MPVTNKRIVEILTTAMEKPEIANALIQRVINTLNQQPEPEPVAWAWTVNSGAGYITKGVGFDKTDIPFAKHTPLYTAPPQREWQGLTDEEIDTWNIVGHESLREFVRAIEAKLKEKNT